MGKRPLAIGMLLLAMAFLSVLVYAEEVATVDKPLALRNEAGWEVVFLTTSKAILWTLPSGAVAIHGEPLTTTERICLLTTYLLRMAS